MKKEELILSLDENSHYKQMALELAEKKEDLEFVVKFVKKEQSSLKYKASKIIRLISEEHPEVLKPHMDEILSWIHHQNSFIKWDGIFVMANLAGYVEQDNQLSYVEAYLSLLEDPQMITAGNAAGSAWKIVHALPQFEGIITEKLLSVPEIIYAHKREPSPECNAIVCGKVLECFEKYYDKSAHQEEILKFAKGQLHSVRKAVAKKAVLFVKRVEEIKK